MKGSGIFPLHITNVMSVVYTVMFLYLEFIIVHIFNKNDWLFNGQRACMYEFTICFATARGVGHEPNEIVYRSTSP